MQTKEYLRLQNRVYIERLMNGPSLRVEGKQNSLFSEGPVIKCLVILPDSK